MDATHIISDNKFLSGKYTTGNGIVEAIPKKECFVTFCKNYKAFYSTFLFGLFFDKGHTDRVHAITQAGRSGAVVENMA